MADGHDDVSKEQWEFSRRRFLKFAGGAAAAGSAYAGLAGLLGAEGANAARLGRENSDTAFFASHPKYKFVMVNHVTTNSFFTATIYGCQDACKLTGTSYRDYYVATFNVRFPRKKRVNAEIAEAAEMVARSRAEADADQQQQVAEAQKESIAAKSSAELMKEYQQGLIPQAESVFQSELTAYQSNRGPLNAVLAALMDRIAFEHDYEQALLDHETALAHLGLPCRLEGQ
jgi:hypothetical protein